MLKFVICNLFLIELFTISLYISIREICQKRKFQGNFTYLAFLDLKKAYDSVSIFSPPGERTDTDSLDNTNTEIITSNNGRCVIIEE